MVLFLFLLRLNPERLLLFPHPCVLSVRVHAVQFVLSCDTIFDYKDFVCLETSRVMSVWYSNTYAPNALERVELTSTYVFY